MKLLEMLKGNTEEGQVERRKNGVNKVLNAPVHLGAMAATLEAQVEQIKSIWVTTRDDAMVINRIIIFIIIIINRNVDRSYDFYDRKWMLKSWKRRRLSYNRNKRKEL